MTETTSERIFERGKPRVELNNACRSESTCQFGTWDTLPVPSAATLSFAGPERTELSDALFKAEAAILSRLLANFLALASASVATVDLTY